MVKKINYVKFKIFHWNIKGSVKRRSNCFGYVGDKFRKKS